MREFVRLGISSRVFSLAAVLGLAVAFSDRAAAQATVLVAVVAAAAIFLSMSSTRPLHWILAVEAGIAGFVISQYLPHTTSLLAYLVVLSLLGGLARGVPGALLTVAFQLVGATLAALASGGPAGVVERMELLAPWTLTTLSAGLVGAWARKARRLPSGSEAEEHYVAARRLLRQLRGLARQLTSGLDPVGISDEMLSLVHARLHDACSAVLVRTDGGAFAPLAYRGTEAQDRIDVNDPVILECWDTAAPATRGTAPDRSVDSPAVAIPLRGGAGGMLGVLVAELSRADPRALDALTRDLDELSLRLDTALAFDEVRSLVTADERQRLAREIHDGVAQEIASLGYVVDDIAAMAADPRLEASLHDLRTELSRVVSELRLSIFDLRSDVGAGAGLGSALSEYARKIGRETGITVHLTLNEAGTRLTPAVEAELFRIAQEAITNARKHSQAQNLWVRCEVDPPAAVIRIRDDGQGLRNSPRSTSYGLRIMQERAERIGAGLTIEPADSGAERPGTCVTVAVGEGRPASTKEMLVR